MYGAICVPLGLTSSFVNSGHSSSQVRWKTLKIVSVTTAEVKPETFVAHNSCFTSRHFVWGTLYTTSIYSTSCLLNFDYMYRPRVAQPVCENGHVITSRLCLVAARYWFMTNIRVATAYILCAPIPDMYPAWHCHTNILVNCSACTVPSYMCCLLCSSM